MALGRIQGNTVLDTNGNPVSGAVIRFYEVGTLTGKTVYSDIAQSVSLGTSITTDASGRFTLPYTSNPFKIRVETSATDSTLIYEQDHIGQDVADVNTQTEGLLTIANVQNSVGTFATTGGSSNAYTVTLSQPITSYSTGQFIKFKANHTNTGAATINVSNVGVVNLQSNLATDLVAGDIVADGVYSAIYDGSGWKLTNSQGMNQSTIQVNIINELTADNGVTVDGVSLKDNDVTATNATLSGNLQTSTATITSDLNTDDISERTTDHGVEIDGVLLKDGNIEIGENKTISSIGSVSINIDTDDNATNASFTVRDNGTIRLIVTDDGQALNYREDGGEITAIVDDGAASESDAQCSIGFRYATTVGGVTSRLGVIGFRSDVNSDLDIRNEVADANIDLTTTGTGVVKVNTGLEVDGDVSLVDGDVSLSDSSQVNATGNFVVNIDTDNNSTSNSFQVINHGSDTIMLLSDEGVLNVYSTAGNVIRAHNIATDQTDANPSLEFLYETSYGGATNLIGAVGFRSSSNTDFDIQNSITNGNIDLITSGTGIVRINGSTVFHSGNDGAGSGLDADLLDGQQGSYYTDASNLSSGIIPDARLQTTGTWTPSITNIGTGTIPITNFARREYIKTGDLCIVNCLLKVGETPSDDECRMSLPFNANNLQLLGECWMLSDAITYPNQSDIDDYITTDGVSHSNLNHGSGLVRDGYFYFKTGLYGSIGSAGIDNGWLHITFRYRTT